MEIENLTKEKKSYKSHRAFYACIKNLYFDFEEDDYEDEVSEENLNKDEPQESTQENIKNDILQNTEPSIKETKRNTVQQFFHFLFPLSCSFPLLRFRRILQILLQPKVRI